MYTRRQLQHNPRAHEDPNIDPGITGMLFAQGRAVMIRK